MSKFYRNEKTGARKKFYKDITNGILLCDFSEEDGMTQGYTEVYVTKEQLASDWVLIKFYPPKNKAYDKFFHQFMKDFIYQMTNYGIEEERAQTLTEVLGTEACCGMLYDWLNMEDKSDVSKFLDRQMRGLNEDYRWEVEDSVKELFPFVTKVLELTVGLVNKIEANTKEIDNATANT